MVVFFSQILGSSSLFAFLFVNIFLPACFVTVSNDCKEVVRFAESVKISYNRRGRSFYLPSSLDGLVPIWSSPLPLASVPTLPALPSQQTS